VHDDWREDHLVNGSAAEERLKVAETDELVESESEGPEVIVTHDVVINHGHRELVALAHGERPRILRPP
jgi:hypothetical protein